jgi:hypothetical protein
LVPDVQLQWQNHHTVHFINGDGSREWRLDGLHRIDGPAFIGADGTMIWYKHGKRHRDIAPDGTDEPAAIINHVIYARKGYNLLYRVSVYCHEWWYNGVLHRDDGPARILFAGKDGQEWEWYRHGLRHRDPVNGDERPAVIKDRHCEWWLNGKMHRLGGPAIITPTTEQYWCMGEKAEWHVHNNKVLSYIISRLRERLDSVNSSNENGVEEDKFSIKNVLNKSKPGYLHLPLDVLNVIASTKILVAVYNYKHRKYNKLDPDNNTLLAIYRQMLHVSRFARSTLNGKAQKYWQSHYTYCDKFKDRRQWKLNGMLHRIDGPTIIWRNGNEYWYKYNRYHRNILPDGTAEPSISCTNVTGTRYNVWYVDGKKHRIDGPAYMDSSGLHEYYIDGEFMTIETFINKVNRMVYPMLFTPNMTAERLQILIGQMTRIEGFTKQHQLEEIARSRKYAEMMTDSDELPPLPYCESPPAEMIETEATSREFMMTRL